MLCGKAVGFEVVHEVEGVVITQSLMGLGRFLQAFLLADGLGNGLVDTEVGLGKVEKVGGIAMAEHGEVVAREDMEPMQVVVVAQHI